MSENGTAGQVELLNADDVDRTVARIAHQIIENRAIGSADAEPVVLLGIPSGGVPLAQRLARKIEEFSGEKIECGALDVTLYRDDLRNTPHRALRPTQIPKTGIDKAAVILVDDVLFSGRTIRAAFDALRDLGRPNIIQLAALVDRGHRRLPIKADYIGKSVPTNINEDIDVELTELDGQDRVLLTRAAVQN
ncbi:bifunctional pyr operon transcriptional regulator/uracil phosphoribosyltransferase PyrR [Corynebacterium tapiri]|uniref:Bifunctional protein PyrR n=1 Tax=Corynebacterium tapiri TaxID=1448266 RepID=A0A5C4U847_9CORY|nr:bifunctional pyr operon transcriptional regulator/uracil phosphoribosyltransferase PyrR [Corynebacterium tapiri]TNL99851.1 bifunctional pyr operon transcriptional regulator/uracil phosphoribosyltransferase PyrR [Corynebacterium tapiri]